MASMTPRPVKVIEGNVVMTFPDAIKQLTDGKKIARMAWKPAEDYGLLKDGVLMLWIDGAFKRWLVNDGDLTADDWIIIEN